MLEPKRLRTQVASIVEPEDIHVSWFDISNPDAPVLKIYYDGAWRPVGDTGESESTANKVTEISAESTDVQYPSAKAVYTALQSSGLKVIVSTADWALISADGVRANTKAEAAEIAGITEEELDLMLDSGAYEGAVLFAYKAGEETCTAITKRSYDPDDGQSHAYCNMVGWHNLSLEFEPNYGYSIFGTGRPFPTLSEYFTIEAKEDNTPIVAMSSHEEKTLLYSLDNGATWQSATANFYGTTIATINTGQTIQFKGDNFCSHVGIIAQDLSTYEYKPFYAYGNIMSLLSAENFENLTEVPEECFFGFFTGSLVDIKPDHRLLLPATTLGVGCYENMFYGCTGLTATPELPATILAAGCYSNMFFNCTSLEAAPEVPATTLAEGCYAYMFFGCSSLTAAPELPATTLMVECYKGMFSGCTGLTTAPELPASTLVENCYEEMFLGDENLEYVTCLATDIPDDAWTYDWLNGVAATGTFRKATGVNWPTGTNGIPEGWTVVEA